MRAEPSHTVLLEIDFQHWIIESIAHRPVTDQAAAVRADPTGRGASFHPQLAPVPGDLVLSKHSRNIFDNPDVETNLRLLGVTDVIITGIATDHGVALAARTSHALGYRTSVVADACAGTSAESHDRALAELSRDGITVIRDRYPAPRRNVTRVRSD
ncbi:cysteine hydrolase family protein [Prescottella agglutinans]|uniref:cysteine hydrolase family protein n=1 Tax=Prescottella agglutinans TaxID=1644129 RepID=UPI003D98AEFE